jgi:hypothetical protein
MGFNSAFKGLICCACLLITAEIREIQLAADISHENEKYVMGKW